MIKKQKINMKSKNDDIIHSMVKYQEESSILGNTLFLGFLLFGIIIIILSIIYYFFKISNPFVMGIFAFLISTIISILYFICQRRKKCKIRMIVNIKNH
jgi:O-antigen/teichoic acid export membrane protein